MIASENNVFTQKKREKLVFELHKKEKKEIVNYKKGDEDIL